VNGLAIEGGETLGYEIASAAAGQGLVLDRLFVQVGGGALASACIQSLREARALGVLPSEPRIHTVQTRGAFPLKRAFDLLREREPVGGSEPAGTSGRGAWYEERLRYAAQHRSEFMWPWEEAPRSVAGGILDDETYDWFAVVRGMLATGGDAHVVDEDILIEANALAAETTGIDVDPTGSAGLAGLMDARRAGLVQADENVSVLFTGKAR
jgi:threonine synthase